MTLRIEWRRLQRSKGTPAQVCVSMRQPAGTAGRNFANFRNLRSGAVGSVVLNCGNR
jgi:hypothetical protein